MESKIYYIEIDKDNNILEKIEICNWDNNIKHEEDLSFINIAGKEVNYYNEISGNPDDLNIFLKNKDSTKCVEYQTHSNSNMYIEYWRNTLLGCHPDKFIGLLID